jgi:sporulation protein YlmC with PRC-barrel domain
MKKVTITPILLMLIVSFPAFASGTAFALFETPLRINALMGNPVVNHEGERLGTVHDLVANEEGLLEYLILAKGTEGVDGSELVAVPLDAVRPEVTDRGELRIGVRRVNLDAAPTFLADDIPDFADPHFQEVVRGYFDHRIVP